MRLFEAVFGIQFPQRRTPLPSTETLHSCRAPIADAVTCPKRSEQNSTRATPPIWRSIESERASSFAEGDLACRAAGAPRYGGTRGRRRGSLDRRRFAISRGSFDDRP